MTGQCLQVLHHEGTQQKILSDKSASNFQGANTRFLNTAHLLRHSMITVNSGYRNVPTFELQAAPVRVRGRQSPKDHVACSSLHRHDWHRRDAYP